MPNPVLLGIDAGTTVFKSAAFDAHSGKLLALASRALPTRSPKPGWREMPTEALDRALRATLRELRTQIGERWGSISGVGLAAQGGSAIFAHRKSGETATPMILWNDERAASESAGIRAMKRESWWQKQLLNAWTPSGLARLQWFSRHAPKFFKDDAYVHVGAGEYLYHRLTQTWRQDAGNAIQIGSYNAAAGKLTNSMLALVGFSKDRVAPLRDGKPATITEDVARSYKLPVGIPVAGPYIDQEAALQAVIGVSRKPLLCSLGTAWVGNFSLPADRLGASSIQFVVRSDRATERVVILPLLTGNAVWDWFLRMLISRNQQTALGRADEILSESVLPVPGVICVPHSIPTNGRAVNALYGLGTSGSIEEALRALVCGLCFELHRVFCEVKSQGAIDAIVLSGGASKSKHFCSIIATLFAPLPVYVLRDQDAAGARGALLQFSDEMGKSPVVRAKILGARIATRLFAAYEEYLRAFAEWSDDFSQSVAYTYPKESV